MQPCLCRWRSWMLWEAVEGGKGISSPSPNGSDQGQGPCQALSGEGGGAALHRNTLPLQSATQLWKSSTQKRLSYCGGVFIKPTPREGRQQGQNENTPVIRHVKESSPTLAWCTSSAGRPEQGNPKRASLHMLAKLQLLHKGNCIWALSAQIPKDRHTCQRSQWAQNTQVLPPSQWQQVESATRYYQYAKAQINPIK